MPCRHTPRTTPHPVCCRHDEKRSKSTVGQPRTVEIRRENTSHISHAWSSRVTLVKLFSAVCNIVAHEDRWCSKAVCMCRTWLLDEFRFLPWHISRPEVFSGSFSCVQWPNRLHGPSSGHAQSIEKKRPRTLETLGKSTSGLLPK